MGTEFAMFEEPEATPPQFPVTILDLERAKECYDMRLPMADPCPQCGGFRLALGDYVCWGVCYRCMEPELKGWNDQ